MRSKIIFIVIFLFLGSLSLMYFGEAEKTKEGEGEKGTLTKSVQTTNSWLEKFYIGAVHDGIDCKYDYANLDTLGFNIFHMYALGNEYDAINNKYYPYMDWGGCGAINNDRLLTPVGEYASGVNGVFSEMHSEIPEMRIVTMRPKIEYLCRGQRSDYQCEEVSPNDSLWFYAFNYHNTLLGQTETDTSIYGGDTVKAFHCKVEEEHQEGIVIKKLRANTEQSHRVISSGNQWQGDSYCIWKIKPRIRIDSNFAKNNQSAYVFKLIIISDDGMTVLKDVDIIAQDFLDTNNNYNGKYLEEYYFRDNRTLLMNGDWGDKWGYNARDLREEGADTNMNKADIQIYWYGNCDMWIDYVRVDDDIADNLLSKDTTNQIHNTYLNWIKKEVDSIGLHSPGGEPVFMKYYLETLEFNHLPCAAYVNEKLKYYSGGTLDLIQDLTNTISVHVSWDNRTRIENPQFLKKHYIEKVGFTQVFMESYPMTGCYESNQDFSRIPNTLPVYSQDSIIAQSIYPSEYDNWLQDNLNHYPYQLEGDDSQQPKCNNSELRQDRGNFRFRLQLGNSLSKLANIPFIFMPQAHQWYKPGEVRREPTNEELNMMINTSLCYGVKGILYFAYNSAIMENGSYGIGIAHLNGELRRQNLYGQTNPDKLQTLQGITERMANKWGPYLLNFDDSSRKSAIIDFETDRLNFYLYTYFNGIISFKYGSGIPPCNEDVTPPSGTTYDCPDERYIQAAVFKDNEPYSEYFMLVNRRCSPVNNQSTNDGRRWIYILLDQNSQDFQYFNNWSITDLINDSIIVTFNKNANTYLDLGWYLPGEGKLYKIAPVIQEGGTLVCDENVTTSVTCKGEVFAEDKVINIGNQLTISFTSNGGFNFSGGEFHSGNPAQSSTPGPVFTSVSGQKWNGIKLTDGIKSYISKSTFNNIKQDENAIEFYDCADIKVTNSNFTCPQDENSGGLIINFSLNPSSEIRGPYIYQNTFTSNSSNYPAVEIISNASNITPLLMEQNTFTASGGENAVFLSGVTGGAIKCNSISNYSTGIQFLLSNLDIYNNTISSSLDSAKGIYGSGSGITIGADNYFLGGKNNISLSGNAGTDIKVEDSYFDMDGGKNLFNIKQNSGSYHLFGYFPENYQGSEVVYCRGNCFKADNTAIDSAIWYITLGPEGELMTFDFSEQDCNLDFTCNCEDEEVFELGDGINDTVCLVGQGMGGGEKVAVAVAVAEAAAGEEVVEYAVYKELKDSISVNTRKREYVTLENQCNRMLQTYPDSSGSREYIMKLYLSVLQQNDTTNQKMSALKSFLEQLITNNPNNPKLIIRAFYVIQKCKVSLKEYTSALLGFQYIMNNNPYSIEGLLSSWDYAVVQMLIGSGGAERDEEIQGEEKYETRDSLINRLVKSEKTGKSKEQSKIKYYRGIESVLQSENSKQEERIRNFEKKNEKLEKPVGNRSIGKENIEILKKIKEAVKIKKPKSREEHIKIVNTDIRNIFGTKSKQPGTNVKNIIPTKYSLSQNYPNPFNPVTKISFALPKESKVKLIIYDILGREVVNLINNENLSAGTYIREFNGSNLASGVYFLRILVNDGKDFTDVKKIVLLK